MSTNIVIVSDTHINSRAGLCPPIVNLDEGGTYHSNATQRAIWRAWLDFWDEVERLKGDKILVVNGDMGELDAKNRSNYLITRNNATILEMVHNALRPALDRVDKVLIIRGTEAHIGKEAWVEEAIAQDLDNAITDKESASWWHFRGVIEGVRFDIAHHASMGRLPWTEKHAALKVADIITARYADLGAPLPDIAIRSHNHRRSDSGRNYDTKVICTPCWTGQTPFIKRIGQENSRVDIGGDVITCEDGKYSWEPYKYRPLPEGRKLWSIKI